MQTTIKIITTRGVIAFVIAYNPRALQRFQQMIMLSEELPVEVKGYSEEEHKEFRLKEIHAAPTVQFSMYDK